MACSVASLSVAAQETCSCKSFGIVVGSLPASRAPFSKLSSSIFSFSAGAAGVIRPLLGWRGGRNQTIAHASRGLCRFGTGRGNKDRTGLFRAGIETCALHAQVLAGIAHLFAGEELLNDLDGLHHAFQPHGRLWPCAADDMFVQRLACTDPQPEAVGIHGSQRCRRLRDDGRVIAIRGAGDARAKGHALRRHAQRAHPRPHERALTLLSHPGMKVIGGHRSTKARRLRFAAKPYQVGGVELFHLCGITKYWHNCSPLSKYVL